MNAEREIVMVSGAEPPAGSRGRAPGQRIRGEAPSPKLDILSFRSANEALICSFLIM